MIRTFTFIFWIGISLSGIAQTVSEVDPTFKRLKDLLINPSDEYVMVVAHRGDWRNFPENSVPAIQSCIDMGVDMVEIDVALTEDSVLILMHDKSLERTTTGNGLVRNLTYQQIRTFYLRDGLGRPTEWKVPTLEEALYTCQGNILINLDKAEKYIELIYPFLKKTNTVDHVAIGSYKSLEEMKEIAGTYLDSIYFMPKLKGSSKNVENYLGSYFSSLSIPIVQIKFESDDSPIRRYESYIKSSDKWLWINTITANRSGNHHDDMATYDIEGSYEWVIENGFNMIQTDRPVLLLEYLRKKGLHD